MPARKYKRGPRKQKTLSCPNCSFKLTYGPGKTATKKKSAKRVARGKRLAASLPRDEKGKFLPAGSVNRFRTKRKGKERIFEGSSTKLSRFR